MPKPSTVPNLSRFGRQGRVSDAEVLQLRREVFADGIVARGELEAVFGLAGRAPAGDASWPAFLIEATADFFLNEEMPRGYLTDEEFAYLDRLLTKTGKVAPLLALDLLIAIEERAVTTPPAMSERIAERLVEAAKPDNGAGGVGADLTDLIRRHLYAAGGEGAIAVTREEAELLFDIHDLTASADNHPGWSELFVKAIAAHLMQHIGYRPLPREEALRLHDWVKDQSIAPGGFFSRMVSGGFAAIREAYGRKSIRSQRNADDEIATAIAEQVTAREADWLADRIGRNGRLDEIEQALIAYMRDLGADLPPKLQALVERAA